MSLKFRGSQNLRLRLVSATLSGKSIRIEGIRERDQAPGLRDYEACLLRLLEKVTDGCTVEINETGTPSSWETGDVQTNAPNGILGPSMSWRVCTREVSSYLSTYQQWDVLCLFITKDQVLMRILHIYTQEQASGTCLGSSQAAAVSGTTVGGAEGLATSWSRWSACRCLERRSAPHSLDPDRLCKLPRPLLLKGCRQ